MRTVKISVTTEDGELLDSASVVVDDDYAIAFRPIKNETLSRIDEWVLVIGKG